jgi:Fe-Mn family superoxide dismutase
VRKAEGQDLTRREVLALMAGATGVALVTANATQGGTAMREAHGLPPAYRGNHQPKPLPFDPAKLRGLSERLLRSHHDNNYTGAVKRLNLIQQQLGQLVKKAPPYQTGSLKREELIATNSMVLHEAYFANLGGDGQASGTITDLLKSQYGSVETWEHDFRQTGLSLAGGSGWVILAYDASQWAVHNYWSSDHAHALAWATPLLVMDMYEHSYAMDYGANARGYIDAFFQNLEWDEVNRRAEAVRARGADT